MMWVAATIVGLLLHATSYQVLAEVVITATGGGGGGGGRALNIIGACGPRVVSRDFNIAFREDGAVIRVCQFTIPTLRVCAGQCSSLELVLPTSNNVPWSVASEDGRCSVRTSRAERRTLPLRNCRGRTPFPSTHSLWTHEALTCRCQVVTSCVP